MFDRLIKSKRMTYPIMKSIIIDDDLFQRHLLSQYIDQIDQLVLINEFDSAQDAMVFLGKNPIDIIFLDIMLPEMNGVEFLEQFKPEARIILISSEEKYAINGYHFEVEDYLLKPISFARFNRAINKLVNRINQKTNGQEATNFLFIKDKGVYQKILIPDILYVQSSSEYVTIYTNARRIMLYSSMDGILKKLPDYFLRVHRSFIVNLNFIDRVNGNTVEINNQSINVSKTYHDSLMNSLGLKIQRQTM